MTRRLLSRRFTLAGLAGAAVAISAPHLPAGSRTPATLVANFHTTLLAVMRASDMLGFDGRYARLKPVIEDSFHLTIMTQIATGRFWHEASPEQKTQLVQVFGNVSVGTYANRFSGYSGQSFQTKVTREGPQKTILVDTVLKNPSDKDVAITYVCREIRGAWRIIDVLLSTGISELAVRRSEYRRVLKSDGIDGLISTLKRKARNLRSAH